MSDHFARLGRMEGLAELGLWLGEDLSEMLPGRQGLVCLCPANARDWFCFRLPSARFSQWPGNHPLLDEIRGLNDVGLHRLAQTLPGELVAGHALWGRCLRDSRGGLVGVLVLARPDESGLDEASGLWMLERGAMAAFYIERLILNNQVAGLETAREELESLKSRFVDTVTHELKTPLTSILGFCSLAQPEADKVAASPLPIFLRSIQDSARKLEQLINEVLIISDMATAEQSLDIQELDFPSLLAEFRDGWLAQRKDGSRVVVPAELPAMAVLVDGRHFLRILEHLVGNALEFSGADKPVRLSWKFITGRRKSDTTDFLRMDVADEGVGIPQKEQERIFQRFYQVDGSSTREHGGAGLGLALAKESTEAMGGRLWLASEPGVGSTFSFTVPVPRAAAKGEAEAVPEAPR